MTYTMLKNAAKTGAVALAAIGFAAAAHAADVAAGKAMADAVCAACHGKDGNTPIDPSYPKIAGQHRDYLERAMLDYKTNARKNPIMAAQMQPLSRGEIANLAAFYAGLPGVLQPRRP
jgi:cytochrome c553